MGFFSFMLLIIIFISVLDNNSKIKTIHRKIYHEDKEEKQKIFKRLSQNVGKTIKINIKEGYEEYG